MRGATTNLPDDVQMVAAGQNVDLKVVNTSSPHACMTVDRVNSERHSPLSCFYPSPWSPTP